eukprot:EG_transcript_21404
MQPTLQAGEGEAGEVGPSNLSYFICSPTCSLVSIPQHRGEACVLESQFKAEEENQLHSRPISYAIVKKNVEHACLGPQMVGGAASNRQITGKANRARFLFCPRGSTPPTHPGRPPEIAQKKP